MRAAQDQSFRVLPMPQYPKSHHKTRAVSHTQSFLGVSFTMITFDTRHK